MKQIFHKTMIFFASLILILSAGSSVYADHNKTDMPTEYDEMQEGNYPDEVTFADTQFTFYGHAKADSKIVEIVNKVFDLRPAAIIRDLDLRRPIYSATASYGHFGRTDIELPWEKTDKAEEIKKLARI